MFRWRNKSTLSTGGGFVGVMKDFKPRCQLFNFSPRGKSFYNLSRLCRIARRNK